jgi:peroxiredoxin
MAALLPNTQAPEFTLPAIDGQQFSLKEALSRGPVLAAFFKVSCPVCQYAFPFLERIFKSAQGKNVTVVGISQDRQRDTQVFMKEFGITFPVLLDDPVSYPVSNAYGLTNVPSIFWISADGKIEIASVGWSRQDIEEIYRRTRDLAGDANVPLFHSGEDIRDFRAG